MNLALWVLAGGSAGLAAGLFFGEFCAVLKPIGSAYLMLMQSMVYPYIICSLLVGLGRLTRQTAVKLLKASWPFYLIAWGLVYASMLALGAAIPETPSPPVLDAGSLLHGQADLLRLLLPANFFADVSGNQVPAVVVFTLLIGIALQKAKGKETLISVLETMRQASLTVWNWVVKLAPVAVFAMLAETAGTVAPAQAGSLLLYIALFFGGTLFLAFVAIPLAASVFLPLSAGGFVKALRDAFVLAVVTSLSVVSLPFILEAAKKQAEESGAEKAPADEIASTSLAVSYPLAQLGNFFIFFFMLFCLYYYRVEVSTPNAWLLGPMTLLCGFGSPSSTVNAIPFLSAWLRVPQAADILWLETMAVTRYGMVLLSVAGFGFITFCSTMNYFGKLRFRPRRAMAFLLATGVFFGLFSWGMARLGLGATGLSRTPFRALTLSPEITKNVPVRMEIARDLPEGLSPMERIRRRGELRVGYSTMIPPFAFFNKDGELAGFDVAFAYSLARALGVSLTFVPANLPKLDEDLARGRYDILMSGIAVNGERLRNAVYSNGYYANDLALVVPKASRARFLTMEEINQRKDLKLGVLKKSVLWDMTLLLFPNARPVEMKSFDELAERPDIDGMLWAEDQAVAWTQDHPDYIAVRTDGLNGILLYGWVMPSNTQVLDDFANHWLELKKADGFYDEQVRTWFRGEPPRKKKRRWSVLHDVLGE